MTEYVMVVPAPDTAALRALGDPAPQVTCTLERGTDASGRERLRAAIMHTDPRVVADAREAWLRAFASVGTREAGETPCGAPTGPCPDLIPVRR